jgi:hypothetical protein
VAMDNTLSPNWQARTFYTVQLHTAKPAAGAQALEYRTS